MVLCNIKQNQFIRSLNYSPFSMVPETKQRVPKTTHWVPETNPLVHGNEPLGNVSVLFLAFGLFVIVHCMYTYVCTGMYIYVVYSFFEK